ncbi:uncharacterized protein [Lepeophtheirus salmonis]|uniref:Myb-like domain-containing protein n=1 Tax=Lepeophtheirus salmonis TaxID=72036 RepID=A0A0K2UXB8_LEPSM|nr:uncharacterized protein LOC121131242 [Lepeophtheirus salmonis]
MILKYLNLRYLRNNHLHQKYLFSTLKLQNLHKSLQENAPINEKVSISETGYVPPSPGSSHMNSIVRYVLLESNLQVHKYDALLQNKIPISCKRNKKGYESLFHTHGISPVGLNWSLNEEKSVLRAWKNLVAICQINNSKEVALEFISIPWRRKESYKKHVLGMYVGQDLNRHGNDAFLLWSTLIQTHKSQTFSLEEDAHIHKRVKDLQKEGYVCNDIYKIIAKELNRRYPYSIKRRYELLYCNGSEKRLKKRFDTDDDHLLLQSVLKYGENDETFSSVGKEIGSSFEFVKKRYYILLFGSKVESKSKFSLNEQKEMIRSILIEDFPSHEPDNKFYENLRKKFKRNPKTLKDHWTKIILPVIRSHEEGILFENWKYSCLQHVCKSLSDPNSANYAVNSPLELNYSEIIETVNGQTRESVKNFLLRVVNQFKESGDFGDILRKASKTYKYNHKSLSSQYKFSELVDLYKEVKNELK